MFYEVKANLTPEQLALMARAGVRKIQPGIESLSSHVLALMKKGTRSATNVNLLRWCLHHGIEPMWNLLWGFPGERWSDYEEQAALLPRLHHLVPPRIGVRIWMERFSPLFTDPGSYPRSDLRPITAYRYVFPEHVDLDRAAYFFEYQLDDTLPDEAYVENLAGIAAWQAAWEGEVRPTMWCWSAPGVVVIEDARVPDAGSTVTIEGLLADAYRACGERPLSAAHVKEVLGAADPEARIEAVLDSLVDCGLVLRDGNLFLALAVPTPPAVP
jgi:ribosomal peptide maturation radical SAM protein 1